MIFQWQSFLGGALALLAFQVFFIWALGAYFARGLK
jgi:hypothetical protein